MPRTEKAQTGTPRTARFEPWMTRPISLDRIELRIVRLGLVRPFATALGTITERESLLVRIDGHDLTGWGECAAFTTPWYSPETTATAWQVIREFLVPALGSGQTTVHDLQRACARIRGHSMAKAAVENALLDLVARRDGVPLHRLLGATGPRPTLAGISLGLRPAIDDLLADVADAVKRRYHRVKLKIRRGQDVEVVREVRRAFPDLALTVDANRAYTAADTATLAALDEFALLMIEQPLGEDDFAGHARLQAHLRTAICLDESIRSRGDIETAAELASCRVIAIKQGRLGGLLQARQVHDLCGARGLSIWCGGMLETGIGRAVNLHLQTLPGFTAAGDTSESACTFAEDLVEPAATLDADGTIQIPPGGGSGVRVLEERVETCTVAREVVFERRRT